MFEKWQKNANSGLVGSFEMPMAFGIVGGAVSVHPISKIALKILGVKTDAELDEVAASAGLAYNLVALQALVTGGVKSIGF